ncbi:MAG: HupE/UreJ family protein, partial [Verrucomicrobiaceae bacterium]
MAAASAHVVTQLYAESKGTPDAWSMEVLFEAGFAVPAIREDPVAAAPDRQWLLARGPEGWEALRVEAERYLRESLSLESSGRAVEWTATFIDFGSDPPAFPVLLTNGAYLRIKVEPVNPTPGPLALKWASGEGRPTFILKSADADGGYLTLEPGKSGVVGKAGEEDAQTQGALLTSFRQGFLHVVPMGWDHVLFVLGLFFYRRKWRPLLNQSLAFTAAHTVTLGLAAAGIVKVSGNWVEPVIALSLVAVALENLRASKEADGRVRLAIVFGFGLIHGLGFAGALSVWLMPGEGFLPSLLMANLGVEAAQA